MQFKPNLFVSIEDFDIDINSDNLELDLNQDINEEPTTSINNTEENNFSLDLDEEIENKESFNFDDENLLKYKKFFLCLVNIGTVTINL